MGTILDLAWKDLRLLGRDKFGLFWIFAFPLLYAAFFGMIFGGGDEGSRGKLSIALVDLDGSPESGRFVQRLADSESLKIDREQDDSTVHLFTREEAQDAVRHGKKTAYLAIPAGYGATPFAMFSGEGATLELGIDPARKAEAGFLQGILMQSLFQGMSDSFGDKDLLLDQLALGREEVDDANDIDSGQKLVLQTLFGALETFLEDADLSTLETGVQGMGGADGLVDVVEVARDRSGTPRSPFEITFPQAMVWGLMGVALGFAITLVRERTQGTLLRLRMAPLGRTQLLAGKALACFVMCLATMVVLLAVGSVFLGVHVGSPALLVVAMVATSIAFTGIMMTASVMGKTENAVAGAAWGTMMPFAMIGGGMIPLIAMPSWLVTASDFSPFKWAILSMEGAIWRGFGAREMVLPCLVLVGIGVGFFAVGAAVFRRAD